ncbi:MAG: glutaredoxin [Actinobacteria bacterium]|nr:glutaredoxin [Actinomycetota bacterium]
MKNLTLYYSATCPFCQKVLRFCDANGITLDMRSTSDPTAREELIRVGGKSQVPCLFIDGEPLYESNDIIGYLKDEFKV